MRDVGGLDQRWWWSQGDVDRLKIQFGDKRLPSSSLEFSLLVPMFILLPVKTIRQGLPNLSQLLSLLFL